MLKYECMIISVIHLSRSESWSLVKVTNWKNLLGVNVCLINFLFVLQTVCWKLVRHVFRRNNWYFSCLQLTVTVSETHEQFICELFFSQRYWGSLKFTWQQLALHFQATYDDTDVLSKLQWCGEDQNESNRDFIKFMAMFWFDWGWTYTIMTIQALRQDHAKNAGRAVLRQIYVSCHVCLDF